MDDPDIVLLIDPHPDGPAEQPIVGKGLGPKRIDLEDRGRYAGACFRVRSVLQQRLTDAETDDGRGERHGGDKITLLDESHYRRLPVAARSYPPRPMYRDCARVLSLGSTDYRETDRT